MKGDIFHSYKSTNGRFPLIEQKVHRAQFIFLPEFKFTFQNFNSLVVDNGTVWYSTVDNCMAVQSMLTLPYMMSINNVDIAYGNTPGYQPLLPIV